MTEGIEQPNQEKIRRLGEKGTYKYLGILDDDTIKYAEMKENIQKDLQENEKTTRNLIKGINTEACSSRMILGTILKMDERRTSTNRPKNKKTHDYA